ncbi:MAG: nucleoside transporter C-terminal domain-containing protein [Pseudohongiella sp.]|nr:nucleoside transporter C-terminal domain-containing protein [Pseudohongiella sp.]MDO9521743.1 nucleoside transporter C-terminal domain-containing protein [Pseudohongiella sp.]MDP2128709.1 nucleoside transporter C-terminal domain-containing protein [Pseudohongiella sp.]
MQAWLGLVVLLMIAWLWSENRRALPWRLLLAGLGLQFVLALMIVNIDWVASLILSLNSVVSAVDQATQAGTSFVFGYLGGGASPFEVTDESAVFLLAFRAIPLILVFSVLSALGWHWRVLPWLIRGISKLLQRSMKVGGGIGLGAAASIFIGMVEAPLTVRPLLQRFDRGEWFVLMTCGMATVAGTVMFLYASVLEPIIPGALGHILAASIISAPAAILIASIMVPMTQQTDAKDVDLTRRYSSTMDAITQGTSDGLRLAIHVVGMLLVLVALVALTNLMLSALPQIAGDDLSVQRILGWLFSPLAWLIGIPWSEAMTAGSLLGSKMVLNELIAYLEMAALDADQLSQHSRLIMTYALCGFANLGSLGIMIGGLVAMCPERRDDILQLAPRTLVSGTLATLMTGAVIGLVS